MKLWTTLSLDRLPEVLKKGFTNPYSDELLFWNNPQVGAENALSFEGELAFIEAEIPDDQFESYFEPCLGISGDEITDLESQIEFLEEEGGNEGDVSRIKQDIKTIETMETAQDSLDFFGYVCLTKTLPPELLKLLDPAKMLEAVQSGDAGAVANAVEAAEATPFKSLSAAFWVWLIFLIREIFGPGYGLPELEESPAEKEEERIERMRQTAAKRARKRPRKKKKRA